MPINVIKPSGRIIDRHYDENMRADLADIKAVQDYNIMMGVMEDPGEEEEDGE